MSETQVVPPDARSTGRKVAVVLNGRAGALLDRSEAAAELEQQFAASGLDAQFIAPDAGTLTERLAQAAQSGAEIVVVAGGDGTIACAAQALAGTETTLGILPFGTMNLLAKDLGIPIGDTAAAIATLAAGVVRMIDVGEVGDRVFLCASMLGLPAELGRYREAQRSGDARWRRWTRFARAALRLSRRYVAHRMVLELSGEAITSRAPSITIAVNRLDDASSRLFARARLDGGEFAVYLAERPRWREVPPMVWDLLRGNWRAGGAVEEKRSTDLVIRGRRRAIRVMNDGEQTILRTPLHYRLRPGALRVVAPHPASVTPEPAAAEPTP